MRLLYDSIRSKSTTEDGWCVVVNGKVIRTCASKSEADGIALARNHAEELALKRARLKEEDDFKEYELEEVYKSRGSRLRF